MAADRATSLEGRVVQAAETALEQQDYVAPLDILLGLRWLPGVRLDGWRQGRLPYLEAGTQVSPAKLAVAMQAFHRWARERGLEPIEADYQARTRDRRPLRFTENGDAETERAYRTHWISPDVSDRKRQAVEKRASKPPDFVVIAPLRDWICEECGGTGDFLIMGEPGPLCMTCADMDHLVFLPSGNAALSRRAKQASGLAAVVVRFSRSRKRYERQGVLVEEAALEEAEAQCLADEEVRARRRERDRERRAVGDEAFAARFAAEILRRFPGCEPERAQEIARHAAARGSGRVGRTAAARELDPEAIHLAVVASVRHRDTPYDQLLMSAMDRHDARAAVRDDVDRILDAWRHAPARTGD